MGWREITAVGDGVTLRDVNVPAVSRSDRLTAYPNDLLQSPLDQRSASVHAEPGGPAAARLPARLEAPVRALPRGIDAPTRAFTSLVARHHLSVSFGVIALGLAIVLGAIHALAPGHGKTVMAAYLVGQRGNAGQAALIGLTVTATHTAGVLALGLALSASSLVAPERLYPWLGLLLSRVRRLGSALRRGRHRRLRVALRPPPRSQSQERLRQRTAQLLA